MSDTFAEGHGLFIGVGADLPGTVNDAGALYKLFISPEKAAYPEGQVELLIEKQANRQGILDALDRLIERANKDPESTVVVYFSGHGGYTKSGSETSKYFLVPYGYNKARRAKTAVSGVEFSEKIKAINTKKLVVILDCCHAGGVTTTKNAGEKFVPSAVPPPLTELKKGSGRVIIASSRDNEFSYVGTPYSIFTACLLEALQGKAASAKNGFVRILDIISYLGDEVPARTSDSQHPVNEISNFENFVVCFYVDDDRSVSGRTTIPIPFPSSPGRTTIPISPPGSPGGGEVLSRVKLQHKKQLQKEKSLRLAYLSKLIIRLQQKLATPDVSAEIYHEGQLEKAKAEREKIIAELDQIEKDLQ
jgi:hypothetical protein